MSNLLILATGQGLLTFERDGAGWREAARGLEGQPVTSVIAREGVILAGTERGVYRSDDLGRTWEPASAGLTKPHIRWLAYHPDISDREFAGVEPVGIFVSRDGGGAWRECPEVDELRRRHKWWMPYGSGTGCVRGFAFHGSRAYAAVEVGGVLRSDDGGDTWRLAEGSDGNPDLEGPPEPLVYPDVHSILAHPNSPDTVFAPTGGGFYRSDDGGRTWACLYECYCRAVWIDPAGPDHLVLGPADYVDSGGRIEQSHDGGRTWRLASDGLDAPWRHGMVERFAQAGDELLAALADGRLFAAPLSTLEWRRLLPEVKDVNCATVML